jgi:Mce-associated membrane protein
MATSACTVPGTAVPLTGNLAVIDASGSNAAPAAVKTAAEAVFTYDSGNPGAFDQAVAANVTGAAKGQLTALRAGAGSSRTSP